MERVKLIWDFRGPNATQTAKHHAIHLNEFAQIEQLENPIIDDESINPNHHIAFMVVDKSVMNELRERIKPTRGQLYRS